MCQFLSAVVLRNGDLLHHPLLDSHADILRYFKVRDDGLYTDRFAKIELTPKDWLDVATWTWRVDEPTRPDWLDEVEADAERRVRALAARMILRDGDHDLILDGCWIVGGTAKIRDVRSGWIRRVQDSAQISDVGDSAQISGVGDSAQITRVWGSAQISGVGGSAQITRVGDSAQITRVWGSARISDVGGSARITRVGDSAQISGVGGSAQITRVGDSAQISGVGGSAQITRVWGSAQITRVGDSARISDVGDSAILDASAQAHLVKP